MNSRFSNRLKKRIKPSNGQKSPILNFLFVYLPEQLDYFLRKKEYQFHQLYRPNRDNGYSRLASILGTLTVIFLIYGPTLSVQGYQAFMLACVALLFNWSISHWFKFGVKNPLLPVSVASWLKLNYLLAAQWITIFILCLFLWYFPGLNENKEADNKIYHHALIPIIFILYIVIIPLAYLLAAYLFPKSNDEEKQEFHFSSLVDKTELVFDPHKPNITWGKILRAMLNVPFIYPLYLIFPSSIAVIFIKHYETMRLVALIFLVFMWLFLAFVGLHTRYASMLTLWKRTLFIRGQLIVSLVIIAISIGRLLDIDYVTTIIESIPSQVFFFYILSLYSLLWFYGYWLNRILTERLFLQLGNPEKQRPWSILYQYHDKDRYLQIHGGTRFIAINPHTSKPLSVFSKNVTIYERIPLLKKLVEGSGSHIENKIELGETIKRYNFYFSLMNIVAFTLFSLSFFWLYNQGITPEYAEEKIKKANIADTFVDIKSPIFQQDRNQPVIFLSASGGGTRAALFTASLLRGLHQENKLKNIALVSGVSGGGTALAYYASHQKQLLNGDNKSWDHFSNTMAQPFIQDVLEGIFEWRILKDIRLGTLLKESFEREFNFNSKNPNILETFGAVAKETKLGIILNTSLAGHPYYITQLFSNKRSIKKNSSSLYQGGRLIFTNIKNAVKIFTTPETASDKRFKYVVVDSPKTSLATAAALNANFPPIFSNAAVDLVNSEGKYDRYWVTDGGAVDNRGSISMLLALKSTLINCPSSQKGKNKVNPIHIIIADASAGTIDFSQNRGVSTALSASGSITNLLIAQLINESLALYTNKCGGKADDFKLYYLAMPEALRARGGMGTHWLMPGEVTIYPIKCPDKSMEENKAIPLKGKEIKQIIDLLHQPQKLLEISQQTKNNNLREAINIIIDSEHQNIWHSLIKNKIFTKKVNERTNECNLNR